MRVLVIAALVCAAVGVARADDQPWKQGVSAAQMAAAQKLLDEGNAILLEHDYKAALDKYQQAIAIWDHPAIRFNIVRCLIQLDRPVEASANLDLALKYGAAPLEENVYNEALAYQKLLAHEIATVDVSCAQSGVELTLDGQPLVTCPGAQTKRITPGRHQVVGKRAGLLTRTVDLVVIGGEHKQVSVSLEPPSAGGKIVHRWSAWIPWVVFASGFVVAGAGGVVEELAVTTRDQYYAQLQAKCGSTGCTTDPAASIKDAAVRDNRIAVGVIATGAAVVATGAVMLYLNRARTIYPDETERVVPTAAPVPGGAVLGLAGRF